MGESAADIIVKDIINLEIKSVSRIIKAHEVQMVNWLAETGKLIGLFLTLEKDKFEIKRKIKELRRIIKTNMIKKKSKNNFINLVSPVNN